MSHFSCIVFSKTPHDVEELLAPYNECDEAFFEFEPADEAKLRQQFEIYNEQAVQLGEKKG